MHARLQVLLVENHSVFAETVTRLLLANHSVTTTATIAGARTNLSTTHFDVVLVDFDLDDGTGDALVRELIADGFAGRIVAISGRETGNDLLLEAGAHAVCAKAQFHFIDQHLRHDAASAPP